MSLSIEEALKKLAEATDHSVDIFSLNEVEGWAKVVDCYDADTIRLCFYMNDRLVKFNSRLMDVKSPDLRPRLTVQNREEVIQ